MAAWTRASMSTWLSVTLEDNEEDEEEEEGSSSGDEENVEVENVVDV